MSSTPRLEMPLLAAGQAQKELFHNEALQALDFMVAPAVEEPPRSSPPPTPTLGACYIIGTAATGSWSGRENALAGFTSGGWRFLQPADGMTVHVRSTRTSAVYAGGSWTIGSVTAERLVIGGQQVVGGRGAAITAPSGGTTVDGQARAAIGEILSAMRLHGLIAT